MSSLSLSQTAALLDRHLRLETACAWDNCGLLLMPTDRPLHTVLSALELTEAVLYQAIEQQAELILTHHPAIFKGLRSLRLSDPKERLILQTMQAGIGLYSAHTNADAHPQGLNHTLARTLGLSVEEPLGTDGIGVIGHMRPWRELEDLCRHISRSINLQELRLVRAAPIQTGKTALCTGAGADYIDQALQAGCEIYITGDLKYHQALEAAQRGLNLIDIGHFGSEKHFSAWAIDFLKPLLPPSIRWIEAVESDPFETFQYSRALAPRSKHRKERR